MYVRASYMYVQALCNMEERDLSALTIITKPVSGYEFVSCISRGLLGPFMI